MMPSTQPTTGTSATTQTARCTRPLTTHCSPPRPTLVLSPSSPPPHARPPLLPSQAASLQTSIPDAAVSAAAAAAAAAVQGRPAPNASVHTAGSVGTCVAVRSGAVQLEVRATDCAAPGEGDGGGGGGPGEELAGAVWETGGRAAGDVVDDRQR
jgi:hypothetical protein